MRVMWLSLNSCFFFALASFGSCWRALSAWILAEGFCGTIFVWILAYCVAMYEESDRIRIKAITSYLRWNFPWKKPEENSAVFP